MKARVKIDGMLCGMCEAHMNDAIRRVFPEAKKVKSSHKKGETTFVTDSAVSEDVIKNVVEETGYSFVSVSFED